MVEVMPFFPLIRRVHSFFTPSLPDYLGHMLVKAYSVVVWVPKHPADEG